MIEEGSPRTHELKTWPEYFQAVLDGRKTFEIRRNDRGFEVGDRVLLLEWMGGRYTGRELDRRIVYLTDFEQRSGFVVMAIEPYPRAIG
jgi:hypothetical protein